MVRIIYDTCNNGFFDTDTQEWSPCTLMECYEWDDNLYVASDNGEIFATINRDEIHHTAEIEWHGNISKDDIEKADDFLKEYLHLPD